MQKPARRNHYLSRFHLAGFTPSGQVEDFLYVFDLRSSDPKPRRQRPRNVAFENDYHRIDWPGLPLDSFEKLFGEFEGAVSSAIARVVEHKDVSGEDLDLLLLLVALTASRVPEMREASVQLLEEHTGRPLEEALGLPDSWSMILRFSAEAGAEMGPDELQRMLENPGLRKGCTQSWHFFSTLVNTHTMHQLLRKRGWDVWFAPEEGPNFICSDSPFCIRHVPSVLPYRTPRFDDRDTVVTFPLHRRAALVGRFEGDHGLAWAGARAVAWVNSATIWGTFRSQNAFLYSPSEDFAWLGERGAVKDAAGCFAFLESARRKHEPPLALSRTPPVPADG